MSGPFHFDEGAIAAAGERLVLSLADAAARSDNVGAQARITQAVVPVFCRALAVEINRGASVDDVLLATAVTMSNMALSAALGSGSAEIDQARLQLLADYLCEAIERSLKGDEIGGSAQIVKGTPGGHA